MITEQVFSLWIYKIPPVCPQKTRTDHPPHRGCELIHFNQYHPLLLVILRTVSPKQLGQVRPAGTDFGRFSIFSQHHNVGLETEPDF
jgi:hypothetical protein